MSRIAGWLVPLFGFVVAMGFAVLKVDSAGADPRREAYEAAWTMIDALEAGEFTEVADQFGPDAPAELRETLRRIAARVTKGAGRVLGVRIDQETGDILVGMLVGLEPAGGGVFELRYRPTRTRPRLVGLHAQVSPWGR